MTAVLLTIHTLCVMALVGVVLLQRSEGGALGMGGGGGGMMSGRGAANALTRSTVILAAAFFTTSFLLAMTSDRGESAQEQLERLTGQESGGGESYDPSEIDATDILGTGSNSDAPAGEDADPAAIFDPTVDAPGTDDPAAGGDDAPVGEEEGEPQRG